MSSPVGSDSVPLLTARGITLMVGQRLLVQDLDLDIRAGQFWCLIGPNGVGKTVLLHTLAGARPPAAGQIALQGRALASWPMAPLARCRGLVPQQLRDAFSAPVLDVVLQGRHPHLSRWHWEGEQDHEVALAALQRVGLASLAQRDITTLSGGERQRVALATLLTQDPPLALLDEPLAHLDLAQQLKMLALLTHEVRERHRAMVMSVHDLSLAQRVATHVLLIPGNGRTAVAGEVDQVMREPILSAAFGHPLQSHEAAGRRWWLAA